MEMLGCGFPSWHALAIFRLSCLEYFPYSYVPKEDRSTRFRGVYSHKFFNWLIKNICSIFEFHNKRTDFRMVSSWSEEPRQLAFLTTWSMRNKLVSMPARDMPAIWRGENRMSSANSSGFTSFRPEYLQN